jgi:DNA-binding MarR family transcriptional regulator
MTPAQHQLLLAIRGHDGEGPPSVTEVAERLQLKLHSVGELVNRASAKGLVDRWPDPDDGRRTLLGLTARGEGKLAELSLLHRDELRRFHREMADVLEELH